MKKPRKPGAKRFSWVSGLFLAGAVNISQNSYVAEPLNLLLSDWLISAAQLSGLSTKTVL